MWSTSRKPQRYYTGEVVGGVAAAADCGEGVPLARICEVNHPNFYEMKRKILQQTLKGNYNNGKQLGNMIRGR